MLDHPTGVPDIADKFADPFEPSDKAQIPMGDYVSALLAYIVFDTEAFGDYGLPADLNRSQVLSPKAVSEAIFPIMPGDSSMMTLRMTGSTIQIGTFFNMVHERLQEGIKVIMSDMPAFYAFAADGYWMSVGFRGGRPSPLMLDIRLGRGLVPMAALLFSYGLNVEDHAVEVNSSALPMPGCQTNVWCDSKSQSFSLSATNNLYSLPHKKDDRHKGYAGTMQLPHSTFYNALKRALIQNLSSIR